MQVSGERLKYDIESLAKIGGSTFETLPEKGTNRITLTPQDIEGRKWLIDSMKNAGLKVHIDQAANIIGMRSGTDDSIAAAGSGSHIDTVPNGGWFDGVVGVISALEVARTLNDNNVRTRRPIEVISFTNEEAFRYPLLVGSKVASGQLSVQDLYAVKDKDGVSFLEAIKSAGLSPEELVSPVRSRDDLAAFVEVHIEQGPVLHTEGIQIGIVEGIVGVNHTYVKIEGRPDHAGTTPMNMRKDSLLAAARVALEVNKLPGEFGGVGTVGQLKVSPNATNIVPGTVEIGVDIRHLDDETLNRMMERFLNTLSEICKADDITYSIKRQHLPSATMTPRVLDAIEESTKQLGYTYKRMPSGAGHDTQAIASVTDTAMIFVPSKDGRSHSPLEWTEWADIERGANVLLNTIAKLAA